MPNTAAKQGLPKERSNSSGAEPRPARKRKITAYLITTDDTLWPKLGELVPAHFLLKQADSIEQLIEALEPSAAAVLFWDARGAENPGKSLGRLQQHSARLVVIVLEDSTSSAVWDPLLRRNQIIGVANAPYANDQMSGLISRAAEEIEVRSALLGEPTDARVITQSGAGPKLLVGWKLWAALAAASCAAVAVGVAVFYKPRPAQVAAIVPVPAAEHPSSAPSKARSSDGSENVESLLEKAAQAMRERRYLSPPGNNAVEYYRSVLTFDAGNDEAKQGLDRLAEVLLVRAQTALDQHQFDQALQSLEAARSIRPNDSRTQAMDAKLASMRSELGGSQIQAAIAAQNFERAATLIDEAARAKAFSGAQLANWRETLRRARDEVQIDKFLKLARARIQQDHLIDPPNDNAAYYMDNARRSGVDPQLWAADARVLAQRVLDGAHLAIGQHRYGDAERLIAEARTEGVVAATLQPLQRDLTAARSQQAHEKNEQQRLLEQAQQRLAQGSVVEPANDSALHYLTLLSGTDPKNPAITDLQHSVQAQILVLARAALDKSRLEEAKGLLAQASGLGSSQDLSQLTERVAKLESQQTSAPVQLVILKPARPSYPERALADGVEGWVDLTFVVKADGSVTDMNVTDASPKGVFDRAATDAVKKLRYKPLASSASGLQQAAKMRITFKLPK